MVPPLNPGHPLEDGSKKIIRFEVKEYTVKELSARLDIPERSLYRKLRQMRDLLGTRYGNAYTARQVAIIVREVGLPYLHEEVVDCTGNIRMERGLRRGGW